MEEFRISSLSRYLVFFCLLLICCVSGCTYKLSPDLSQADVSFLKNRFLDSSQAVKEASTWPSNRRYFFLIHAFSQMGVTRCDHYLPADECFEPKKEGFAMTLHSELWQVQKKDGEYRYVYDIHKPRRILKNLSVLINQIHEKPEYMIVFSYLSSDMKVINRITYFMEFAHYFMASCPMRPASWYFVEGDTGFDHLMKSLLRSKEISIRTQKLKTSFLRKRYVLFQPGENGKDRAQTYLLRQDFQTISDEIIKNNGLKQYKELFCWLK